jgi:nitrite reductase/ring-hydroxylating ferredoxin subunit
VKRVCDLSDLSGRRSVRFDLPPAQGRFGPQPREGFVVAGPDGAPRAYVNICPHRGQPVDLGDGRVFLADGNLECQAHGAVFDPATGACVRGPCEGAGLRALPAEVRGSAVFAGEFWPAAPDDAGED